MTEGESFISILLLVIIYFLYQIAKQLSYLTGKKMKISFFNWSNYKSYIPRKTPIKKEPHEKLSN